MLPMPDRDANDGRRADVFLYDRDGIEERRSVSVEELPALLASGRRTWIDFEATDRAFVVPALAKMIELHPLVEENLLTRDHRTSVDEYPGFAHLIVELVHLEKVLRFEKVDILVSLGGPAEWLVTVQDHPGDCFGVVRERLRTSPSFRAMPQPYLLHALCESACRDYLRVLGRFGTRLEHLEMRLISKPMPGLLQRIHAAKRDLRAFRRAVVPLRESIETLFYSVRRFSQAEAENAARSPHLPIALREIHDELGGVLDVLEAYRDATQNLSDLYLTSLSNRVNEVLRVLTIISTIFIPLSFVAGVYGMNFQYMPELTKVWGYPAVLAVMAAMAGAMLLYFWRRGWLRKSDIPRLPSITRTTSFFEEKAKS